MPGRFDLPLFIGNRLGTSPQSSQGGCANGDFLEEVVSSLSQFIAPASCKGPSFLNIKHGEFNIDLVCFSNRVAIEEQNDFRQFLTSCKEILTYLLN